MPQVHLTSMSEPKFKLYRELGGHSAPLNALLFSDDGKFLVSGGDDEKLRVWDTLSAKCVQVLENEKWGQITTLTWVYHEPRTALNNTWLCIGSGRGYISLCPFLPSRAAPSVEPLDWKKGIGMSAFGLNDAIETAAYDHQNSRLVLASHSGAMKMFKIQKTPPIYQELWSTRISDATPRAVFFFGGGHQSLLTVSLETAELICYQAQNHERLWQKALVGAIGGAALSGDEKVLLIDNLSTGLFDVYEFPSQTPLRSLQPTSTRRIVRQAVFLAGEKVVVCSGGGRNEIGIMNAMSGECIQTLQATKGMSYDILQTVAVSTAQANRHLIASGSGSTQTAPVIYLWEKLIPEETTHENRATGRLATTERNGGPENVVNGPVIILVLLLTYSNWSPHLYRLLDVIIEKVKEFFGHAVPSL